LLAKFHFITCIIKILVVVLLYVSSHQN
jgi:hypothetical protein